MENAMFCYQCEMSMQGGCGAKGQDMGSCGKTAMEARLQDMMVFGLRGLSAYREHYRELMDEDDPKANAALRELDDITSESLYFTLTNVNFNFDDHIAQLMKIGSAGVKVMDLLADAHTNTLGVPTPVKVSQNKAEGKAILVSGHNLDMLHKLLEATKDTGVNIYTHSEMLPAHAYPELNKYPHLKGNIGKSWFDQSDLFATWNGTVVVNTNCIVPPEKNSNVERYSDRLYCYKVTGIHGAKKIENDDFSELIAQTLSLPDIKQFNEDTTLSTGHHYKTVLMLAPQILEALKEGKIEKFFVIAGCDAPGKGGEYYREMAEALPENCVIITSSCGKFRFNDIDFGTVPGTAIPRYLDLGQCNDSNGAVHIASALAEALGMEDLNDLPVEIVLSWMEQKAVIILLALFSLGVKNIYIGPKPPQFVDEEIVSFLVANFNLHFTGDAKNDLQTLLKKTA